MKDHSERSACKQGASQFFIVDAVNFLFRAYYAIAPMTNAQGESTNALFGFIRSLNKLIHDFSPSYFVAVFDGPDNKRLRTAIYKEYKSNREGMPPDLVSQLGKALEFCRIAKIPYLSVPGVEADDTIGSITKWMEGKGRNITICSSDKDLCQLVSPHVKVLNPHKDNLLIDREKVKELFGVFPEQIVDYLALVGDASDNIPGVEGIGPKTAVSLLNEHETLENLLGSLSLISGKKRETLEKSQELALLSKQLATLYTDVDFPKEETFFHLHPPDRDALKEFYQTMNFHSLIKELNRELPVEKKTACYHLVDDEKNLERLIASLSQKKVLCIDTETTSPHPLLANLVGIGLGMNPKEAWYIPMNGKMGKRSLDLMKPLFENPHIQWVGHNIKYDLHVLHRVGIALSSIGFDTLIASYLLAPHTQRHNLDELSLEKFGFAKTPIETLIGKGKEETTMDHVPIEQVCNYCCEDVDYTLKLKTLFEKELKEQNLQDLFTQIELPLIPVLARMERKGIYCDERVLQEMSKDLREKIDVSCAKIYLLAGEEFNINSPKQLSSILFEKMGIKPPKKTATGFSTAIEVLEELQEDVPLVKEVITYRSLEKLRSTYVEALPQEINPQTGRIHCSFNQSVAATGRLSCQNPNLQNIPVRTPEGKKIRTAFKPQRPGYSFLAADYSQIELRLLAHLSEDPTLLTAFHKGEDVHAYTASLVFDIPLTEVTEEMRYKAKAVNFGILYGQQAFGLSKQLGISYEQADSFIKTYFSRYPKVALFLESCKEEARKTGKATTLTGRTRPIPEIHSKNPQLRGLAERLAINTPLQGTAADLIKMAMIQIDSFLRAHPGKGDMILQIHDELLFELPDSSITFLSTPIKELMEGVLPLQVPLVVDISIGKNWGAC